MIWKVTRATLAFFPNTRFVYSLLFCVFYYDITTKRWCISSEKLDRPYDKFNRNGG